MSLDTKNRTLVSVIIALIIVSVLYFLVPPTPIVPKGIFLPTAPPEKVVSPEQVNFYDMTTAPYTYKKLGYINVQFYSKETPQGYTDLQHYIKELAAKRGANGVIITLFGHTVSNTIASSALSSYVFRGVAVRTATQL